MKGRRVMKHNEHLGYEVFRDNRNFTWGVRNSETGKIVAQYLGAEETAQKIADERNETPC